MKSSKSTNDSAEDAEGRHKRCIPNERDKIDDVFLDLPLNLSTLDWAALPSGLYTACVSLTHANVKLSPADVGAFPQEQGLTTRRYKNKKFEIRDHGQMKAVTKSRL